MINLDDEDVQTVSSSQAASEILELIAEKKLVQKRKALAKAKAELAAEEVKELELEQQLAVSSRQSDKSRSSRRSRGRTPASSGSIPSSLTLAATAAPGGSSDSSWVNTPTPPMPWWRKSQ